MHFYWHTLYFKIRAVRVLPLKLAHSPYAYDMVGDLTPVSLPKVWKKYLGVKMSIGNF